ncbi:RHS repeat-associated core domain-containing protein [Serratia proteamaculans]|nr:RHS repeat-associated core domain-containing protein [Serratia proteamaculans]
MSEMLLGFNGERLDPVTGTTHLGNGYRAYSPVLMRFTCPDSWSPFGGGGMNPYAYCEGDPINRADPSGHMSWQAGLGIGLGILGILGAVFTGGASIAAAGSISAALATTSAVSLVVGTSALVADVTGIAQAATEESNPQASAALGWASLAFGILSLGAGLASWGHARSLSRVRAAQSDDMISLGKWDKFFSAGANDSADSFRIYSGKRKSGEIGRIVINGHGRQLPQIPNTRFSNKSGQVILPTGSRVNFYTRDGYVLRVSKANGGIDQVAKGAQVQEVAEGMSRNYIITELKSNFANGTKPDALADYLGVDIAIPQRETTLDTFFDEIKRQDLRYPIVEAVFCRVPFEGNELGTLHLTPLSG